MSAWQISLCFFFTKKEAHNEPLLLLCKIIIYSRPICKIGLIFL